MSDHKPSKYKQPYPDVVRRFLDTPQLLPDENVKDFLELFDSLEDHQKPQTSWDYLVTYQATMLTWDILRYYKMKVGVLHSHQRPALESLFRKIHASAGIPGSAELRVKEEARQLAAQWFAEPDCRPEIIEVIEKADYPPNALEIEAFQLALPALAKIEGLIVAAQKRLDQYLKDLEKRSEASARVLRVATERAIGAHDAGVMSASGK
jgi:hypothetical protein